jgi:hypothetical protein
VTIIFGRVRHALAGLCHLPLRSQISETSRSIMPVAVALIVDCILRGQRFSLFAGM